MDDNHRNEPNDTRVCGRRDHRRDTALAVGLLALGEQKELTYFQYHFWKFDFTKQLVLECCLGDHRCHYPTSKSKGMGLDGDLYFVV